MGQLNLLLERANKSRSTASTGMNERSSRSHVLFLLDIHGQLACNSKGGVSGITVMQGGLRLVDLAGSERLDRTGTMIALNKLLDKSFELI